MAPACMIPYTPYKIPATHRTCLSLCFPQIMRLLLHRAGFNHPKSGTRMRLLPWRC